MLVVGTVGWVARIPLINQMSSIQNFSLWSLFSAPLLIGYDMEKLDAFYPEFINKR